MGARPLNPCTTPGCPGRIEVGRCATCRRKQRASWDRQRRATDNERYDWRWRSIVRIDYLTRHPQCALCPRMAAVPDHWPRSRKELLAAGVRDPDIDEYLRPLCIPCHNTATGRNQPGGWARDRRT